MKPTILLLAVFVIAFSSCSTAYKSGQTPDDVYYSPSRAHQDEYVQSEKKNNRQYRGDDEYYDDRYLRMKVQNRLLWSDLDDWYYYDRYSLGFNNYYGVYNNPYNSWNYFYNPYCCCQTNNFYNNPKKINAYSKPRTFNLNTYAGSPQINNTNNPKFNNGNYNNNSNIYTSPKNNRTTNRSSSNGSFLRDIFNFNSGGSSGKSSGSSSSSSPSSSSSSGSSPAPVRKF